MIPRYDAIDCNALFDKVVAYLPSMPATILDIGAGTGRDAGLFASKGYLVTAVEPVDTFRLWGANTHTSHAIEWIDDRLPKLASLKNRNGTFDFILINAVWMHLNEIDRRASAETIAPLLSDTGTLAISARQGPKPENSLMNDVCVDETIQLFENVGLTLIHKSNETSVQLQNRRNDVTWDWTVFETL